MTALLPKPVSSRQFTWDASTRTYVGEISSTYGFGRVYDDACDEGLTIVSAATGREIPFAVDREERDAEGDVLSWSLIPARPADRRLDVRVRLFND